uniref:Reverse transcriptase Ty1/copia-type domain-containing protein n=1 Tax=Fagus sylvatica TaxID=28930 RepID=A0A2N9FRH9_FAGSY
MCIKKGRGISLLFFGGEERGNKLQRYLTNFLLGQHHPIGICECLDARVLFIFLRTPGENGDGDVLRPSPVHQLEPHSSAVDVTDQPHSSGQQLCPASSADCQPVQLTSEDSSHPAQHVYSRRRLHYVSQAKTTPEDQQSSPVASLPVASSDSGSLSQGKHLPQVAKMTTIRGILALAAIKKWPLFQLDVKNAFQQHKGRGDPQESVSIQPPPGFSSPRNPNLVCKLKKAIYVTASDKLKQAPFLALGACFQKFSSFLTASFLIKGSTVAVRILPCLFVDVMVVASSFFYTLTTTFSPGMILLFYSISSRSLATNLSLSSAALLSRHGGAKLSAPTPIKERQAALTTDALPRAFVLGRNLISWSAKKQPLTHLLIYKKSPISQALKQAARSSALALY